MNEKYVKLSDVKKKLNYIYRAYGVSQKTKQTISDALAKIPYTIKGELETTLEAEPVKYGKWEDRYNNGDWHCSVCGAIVEEDEQSRHNWYRCYHCGAKMNGGDNKP